MIEPVTAAGGATAPGRTSDAVKQGEAFERMLVGQLTKTLVDTAMGEGDEEGGSAAVTAYKDMLPDALTEALMSGGGIGLAKKLAEGAKS